MLYNSILYFFGKNRKICDFITAENFYLFKCMLQCFFFYVDSSTNYCILGNFPLEKFKKNSSFYKNVRKVSGSRESSLIVLVSYDVEVTLKVCKAV